ncbi:MAG: metallophosphoesterase [Candidatus Pacearchaeota archaeon]
MKEEKELFYFCLEKNILLEKELFSLLQNLNKESSKKIILFLFENLKKNFLKKEDFLNNLDKISLFLSEEEKKFFSNNPLSSRQEQSPLKNNSIKILLSFKISSKKVSISDFVDYFRARYEQIRNIFLQRNIENLSSIRKLVPSKNSSIIVSVLDKKISKNNNIIFDVEDLTGKTKVLFSSSKPEVFEKAKSVLLDDVVLMKVSGNKDFLFGNDILWPDIFLPSRKKINEDIFIAVTSDLHVGSSMFLEKNFLKFIKWLNLENGKEEIAKKVKYLFIVGDTIDGVGVYPDQERFLSIKNITDQYKKLYEYLSLLRKDIKIIICPGQHDAVWVGEPQPPIDKQWAPFLYNMENVYLVSNPSLVEIENSFKILLYHGAAMHGVIEGIEELRTKYGHKFPARVTKEFLKRRLLSSPHGDFDYIPSPGKDFSVIEEVPDIVCTGDQHRPEISYYNNILLIASSCWQSKTPFEEKIGHEPDPCKVPLFNLKTREIKILDFSEDEL